MVCVLLAHQFFPFFQANLTYIGMPNLYHAVFSNGYQEVSVLDHSLQLVRGGRLRLLASAEF